MWQNRSALLRAALKALGANSSRWFSRGFNSARWSGQKLRMCYSKLENNCHRVQKATIGGETNERHKPNREEQVKLEYSAKKRLFWFSTPLPLRTLTNFASFRTCVALFASKLPLAWRPIPIPVISIPIPLISIPIPISLTSIPIWSISIPIPLISIPISLISILMPKRYWCRYNRYLYWYQ